MEVPIIFLSRCPIAKELNLNPFNIDLVTITPRPFPLSVSRGKNFELKQSLCSQYGGAGFKFLVKGSPPLNFLREVYILGKLN